MIYYFTYYNDVRNRFRNINEDIFKGIEEEYVNKSEN